MVAPGSLSDLQPIEHFRTWKPICMLADDELQAAGVYYRARLQAARDEEREMLRSVLRAREQRLASTWFPTTEAGHE